MQDFSELAYTISPQHKVSTEEMLLISKKCRQRLKPAHPAELILFERDCKLDSGWIRCECSCISGGWEQDHNINHRKVDLCFKMRKF
ncbi:hypothetical protein DPMN_001012 [Dreissena polymorpha]|uniref:Uncharacterized protein n=1 Tax=Dreissena polymorpha TaxID=45954 RepID=A0A9D4RSJ4_DREPO|nr:hypothetical protein DPMN_001012 [Dreissena polymorpha]